MKRNILFLIIFIILIPTSVVLFREPSLDKNWSEESKILPHIKISDSKIEVENLRDWRYKGNEVISKNYYDDSFDLNKIKSVYFLMNPFGKWEGVGHTFFLFEFDDGKTVSVSVEARKEIGEEYKAIKGLFNNYELWYAWGSGADFFGRRAEFYNEDLYMYPLLVSTSTTRALFVDLANVSKELEVTPRFYNTILSNCTNVLADSANRVNKGSIPWNFARIFTGFADDKLYELKLIPNEKSFDEIMNESRIDQKIKEIFASDSNISKENFWSELLMR